MCRGLQDENKKLKMLEEEGLVLEVGSDGEKLKKIRVLKGEVVKEKEEVYNRESR